jgi:Flp pilus assembly protein TadG
MSTIRALRRFLPDRRASIAPMFAVALVPLVGLTGAAVDFSTANRIRTQLLSAADSASIGSIVKSSTAMATAVTMNQDGNIAAGVTDAKNIFNAQIAGKTNIPTPTLAVTLVKSSNTVTSTVSFSASVPMSFMGVFGIKTMTVTGTSVSQNSLPIFIDFYLLLDNTPSMGVGATTADINTMVNNTPDQCAFACHDLSNPNNYYNLAKSLGVTMRIDVLRSATQQLMTTAAATETYSNQFRMAIYTFGSSATNPGLTTIQSITSNLTTAKNSAANIDLMTTPYQNYADDTDTNLDSILPAMNSAIPAPGSGTTAGQPQKVLFFVSDGVADEVNPSGGCSQATVNGSDPQTNKSYVRCQEPLTVSLCTAIKNRGIKIAVLYTTYLPLPTNAWYNSYVAPFTNTISTNMQNCASPGLFFEVSTSNGSISQAMTALFQQAVNQAHLTQ